MTPNIEKLAGEIAEKIRTEALLPLGRKWFVPGNAKSIILAAIKPLVGRKCEHCGSDRIYSGPPDCPGCGAQNCCQTCCKTTSLEKQLSTLREQIKRKDDGGVGLIATERNRQMSQEGWTPAHDDEHSSSELSTAAECYVFEIRTRTALGPIYPVGCPPKAWPWDKSWWKPTGDVVRQLTKAGALIAAEIDRLQRQSAIETGAKGEK